MGKSTPSCFKIITCAGDSVDRDDIEAPEIKGSSGRGWSFRKRSPRHRVLSNTIISEAPSSANKESPELTAANSQVQPNLPVLEKTSVTQCKDEKSQLSTETDPKVSDNMAPRKDDCREDASLDDSKIIILQAAIRRSLAQRLLLKQKSIIKLQAAVRGHVVRKQAVGTLRCVQAIVRVQALIRARRARLLIEASGDFEKQSERSGKCNHDPTLSSKTEIKPHGTYSYISIEQLLKNRFARQLMESTPRTEPINIKCDPLKSDSAWKWLERWMSVSSVYNEELQESGFAAVLHEKEDLGHSEGEKDILVPSECCSELADIKTGAGSLTESSENDDNLITYDANNFDPDLCKSVPPPSSHPQLQSVEESNLTCDIPESALTETNETDRISDPKGKAFPNKEEMLYDHNIPDLERDSAEQPESEAKKNSRKASNPSFIAAQSKFKELSSAGSSVKVTSSSSQDPGVESKVSSAADQPFKSREIGSADNSISNASAVQIGGSECGTELSISSTLDSPDRTEIEENNPEQEPKISEVTNDPQSREILGLEANKKSSILGTNTCQLERSSVNSATGESVSSLITIDSPQLQQKPESNPSNEHLKLESEATHLVEKSSPGASPRSHMTIPESEATPSSQVSIKPKKSRGEKSESNRKNRSSSGKKTSTTTLEQKEHKDVRRRNSFGSAKPEDHAEQAPRYSSSSNSLPSYMQATESARAKAIANSSPRSSPDVHDKDIFIKKRHSLPGTDGRQGSPRIQRSLSQAQQKVKGNETHSSLDRKWRR